MGKLFSVCKKGSDFDENEVITKDSKLRKKYGMLTDNYNMEFERIPVYECEDEPDVSIHKVFVKHIYLNQMFKNPDSRYYKNNSNVEFLFRLPRLEYLRFLGFDVIDNYDWLARMMTNNPQVKLTKQNKHLRFSEKVVEDTYYCGQFDRQNRLNGFGFKISKNEGLEQGIFIHGKINTERPHVFAKTDVLSYDYLDTFTGYHFSVKEKNHNIKN